MSNTGIRPIWTSACLHETYSTSKVDWHGWVFDHIAFPERAEVIEFGCGSGVLWAKNKNRIDGGWKVTLTDMSEGMLRKAKQSIGEAANVSYRVADIQEAGGEACSYDIAIANHMLYHVPNIAQALAEVKRILKPAGMFYASTNGLRHTIEMYELVHEFDPSLPFVKPDNANRFGIENGGQQLREHFGRVRFVPYESNLRVTNVRDLADYMYSIGTELKAELDRKGKEAEFLAFLESRKSVEGCIPITKHTGMFVCSD